MARAAEADARSAGDAEAVAWAILRQGIAHSNDGASAAALDRLHEAHLAFTALEDDLGRTRALARIAADLIDAGRPGGRDRRARRGRRSLRPPHGAVDRARRRALDGIRRARGARLLPDRARAERARARARRAARERLRDGVAPPARGRRLLALGRDAVATAPDEATARLREAFAHAHEAIRHADLAGEPSIRGLAGLTGALALIGLGHHGQAAGAARRQRRGTARTPSLRRPPSRRSSGAHRRRRRRPRARDRGVRARDPLPDHERRPAPRHGRAARAGRAARRERRPPGCRRRPPPWRPTTPRRSATPRRGGSWRTSSRGCASRASRPTRAATTPRRARRSASCRSTP